MLGLVVSPLTSIVAIAATATVLLGGAYLKGREHGREAMLADQLKVAHKTAVRQAEATERVRIEYRDRVRVVREKGEEVIREVERLVPAGGCQLPGGFRLLHDAAARGSLPEPAGRADGAAAPVEPAAAAETVAGNYLACNETAEQLKALQAWVQQQQNVTNP